jgi:hypothetical protein
MSERIEFIEEKKENKASKKKVLKDVLDGSLLKSEQLVGQLPFIFFLSLLAIFYIANRYQAERIIAQSMQLEAEVKELRSEAVSVSSDLMSISKQSEVLKLINQKGMDLKESFEPPMKIVIRK